MMNTPLNELQSKVSCRYMLVTAVAKRARQLMSEPDLLKEQKPVSYAVRELLNDDLDIAFPEEYKLNHPDC